MCFCIPALCLREAELSVCFSHKGLMERVTIVQKSAHSWGTVGRAVGLKWEEDPPPQKWSTYINKQEFSLEECNIMIQKESTCAISSFVWKESEGCVKIGVQEV